MRFLYAGILCLSAGIGVLVCAAQESPSTPATQSSPTAPAPPQLPGKIVFSGTTNANGQTTVTAGPGLAAPVATASAAPVATDAEREAVRFTAYDMDVHIVSAARHIAVRARITVRNDGAAPLGRIPLQISSSLIWQRIRVEGRDTRFSVATIDSDADHTGQLHEAAVPLPTPLAPGQTLTLDVTYAGDIAPNAQRLVGIGAPGGPAIHSDWDGIGDEFTGLRGFGNVVWYPVSSVPRLLGDGALLFNEIGRQELRMTGTRFAMQLTDEFPPGKTPTLAVISGRPVALDVNSSSGERLPGVATASLAQTTLAFEFPSLFLAVRDEHEGPEMKLWTLPVDDGAATAWSAAGKEVLPFLQGWLGQRPQRELTVLDLPDAADAPFEEGAFLATGIQTASADQLEGILAHALTHAFFASPRPWLNEGVAQFMGTLWIEHEQGREQALGSLGTSRQALALMEPASPGESPGQPLVDAYTPIYYRTKAADVLWMLRDLTSDAALSAALRSYHPAADSGDAAGPCPLEKLIEQASNRSDLGWFFRDWVDADHGLPDLNIDGVFPSAVEAGNWLVAVDLSNSGYAGAMVPLTVRSAITSVTRRVLIPAQAKTVERILIQGKPTQVDLNDGSVPEVEASVHVTHLLEASQPGAGGPAGARP